VQGGKGQSDSANDIDQAHVLAGMGGTVSKMAQARAKAEPIMPTTEPDVPAVGVETGGRPSEHCRQPPRLAQYLRPHGGLPR
jgi:hypothetical protein